MKPLKDQLKGAQERVRAAARTRSAVKAPAEPEPPIKPDTEPDFRTLFKDVRPLKASGKVPHKPPRPSAKPRFGHGHAATTETHQAAMLQHMSAWFEPAEIDVRHSRDGMPGNTLRRLKHGHWPVVAELDLHGLDRYAAQDRLVVFLHRARERGVCVRIIHGKGLSSNGEPVLKRMVRQWLKSHPDVLAFCEADDRCGGSGALMVLLKTRHRE
ncbi:Smr/MutS family protein [Crenobacter cavernae]|uniref:DNA mismatch repair protein MutS n=1 Tax=Crenobacter cavernae TaxID=2290923 RepID=A0ABY0FD94_9NEIS|nr:Smr/MutS family protein [Crenobacter cavernae]RXZ42161.1 DNA mismatch repair protein MutS [Crenobacter cavernae]